LHIYSLFSLAPDRFARIYASAACTPWVEHQVLFCVRRVASCRRFNSLEPDRNRTSNRQVHGIDMSMISDSSRDNFLHISSTNVQPHYPVDIWLYLLPSRYLAIIATQWISGYICYPVDIWLYLLPSGYLAIFATQWISDYICYLVDIWLYLLPSKYLAIFPTQKF
jgi:hypothetical protein